MDLSRYKNQEIYINSVEEVEAILSQLSEDILVDKKSKFDFDKFDIEVRLLIRKAKIQHYFLNKLQELRKLHAKKEVKTVSLISENRENVFHGNNTVGIKKVNNQSNKKQYNQENFAEDYVSLSGKSLDEVANICKVKPKILLEILERKLFKVEDSKRALNVQQLSILKFYIKNRLSILGRSDRNNKKGRPSDKEIDISRKPKGSVFIKATQIRN